MKIWYKNEQNTGKIICYCVAVFLLLVSTYFVVYQMNEIRENNANNWYSVFVIITIFMGCLLFDCFLIKCGKVVAGNSERHKEWHNYLVKNGIKYRGEVIEIVEKKHRKASRDYTEYKYYFRVRYIDLQTAKEQQFLTSELCFKPKKGAKYICDVYKIYDNKAEYIESDQVEDLYSFSINPFVKSRHTEKKNEKKWFGDIIADNFQDINLG